MRQRRAAITRTLFGCRCPCFHAYSSKQQWLVFWCLGKRLCLFASFSVSSATIWSLYGETESSWRLLTSFVEESTDLLEFSKGGDSTATLGNQSLTTLVTEKTSSLFFLQGELLNLCLFWFFRVSWVLFFTTETLDKRTFKQLCMGSLSPSGSSCWS